MAELYKLLLVDDEDDVRGRISSRIHDESGFQVVGKAGNGYDALELIDKLCPDIVLTDIKMPFIDGIELAKIIKRDYPMTRVAFISGYDQFDYAKQAIDLNVLSYLMKPITSEEMESFLKKVKIQLDTEREELRNITSIKEKYNDILPIIGDSFLSSLLHSSELKDADFDKLSVYGINLGKGKFVTCLIDIDISSKYSIQDIEELRVKIMGILKSKFKNFNLKQTLVISDGLVLIINLGDFGINELDRILFEVLKTTEDYLDVDIKIGVSRIFDELNNLPSSFKEAKKAMGHSRFMNLSRIVYASEFVDVRSNGSVISSVELNSLDNIIRYGSDEAIVEYLEKIRLKLSSNSNDFLVNREFIMISFANLLMNLSGSVKSNLMEELDAYHTVEDLLEYVKKQIFDNRNSDANIQSSKIEKMLKSILDYIDNNFNDQTLSLEKICDEMDVSVSYLSMLLKKQKGITFNKYLVKTRLEKAKELLKYTKMKVVDVSRECGYNEVYYFSHSFKKFTGVSPREYRKNENI